MAKLVRQRMKQSSKTATAASAYADLLERALASALGSDGPLTIGEAARRIAARLETLHAAMETAAAAEGRLEDLMRGYRRQRDAAAPKVYAYLTRIRQCLRAVFGTQPGDEFLGIHGPTPEDPQELHDLAGDVIARTADPRWPTPEENTLAVDFKPPVVAKELKQLRDPLGAALDAIDDGGIRLTVATAARKQATAAFDFFYGKSARYLEAGLELAGLDDLVAQVRPGVGRRGRPAKQKSIAARGGKPLGSRQLGTGALELPAGADAAVLLAEVSPLTEDAAKNPTPEDDKNG